MFTFLTGNSSRDCTRLSRRDFIRIGGLGLGSVAWSGLARGAGQEGNPAFVRDKSVVLLFLAGGPSHIETFNPNMGAPAPFRSETGEVQTSLPGVTFGGTFPELAKHADKLAIVRSFSHADTGHDTAIEFLLTGGTRRFSIGSSYAKLRGANHPRTGMPVYSVLTAPEADGQYLLELGRVVRSSRSGDVGAAAAPLLPLSLPRFGFEDRNDRASDTVFDLSGEVLDSRQRLLHSLDQASRQIEANVQMQSFSELQQRAFTVLRSGSVRHALDLSREDPKILERYDTSAIQVGWKRKRPSSLGKQMLLARRFCEAGCGFVTVQSSGWDMHADSESPGVKAGFAMHGPEVDRAVSAFLADVADRGLSNKILLVITGEFGRSPTINANGGRDHYPLLSTLAFAGGGLRMGQVIGKSGRKNEAPAAEPISLQQVNATIMHTLFDLEKLRMRDNVLPPSLAKLLGDSQPIKELL